MMKKFIESFKEGLVMLSNSRYGDVNWHAKRYETNYVESNTVEQKKVYSTKKLYVTN
jgi:hypothetical protein